MIDWMLKTVTRLMWVYAAILIFLGAASLALALFGVSGAMNAAVGAGVPGVSLLVLLLWDRRAR